MFLWWLDGNFDWTHSKSQFLIGYLRLPMSPHVNYSSCFPGYTYSANAS